MSDLMRAAIVALCLSLVFAGCEEDPQTVEETTNPSSPTQPQPEEPAPAPGPSGDSISDPYLLNENEMFIGAVLPGSDKYHAVTVMGGLQYVVSLTGATKDPDLYVYTDSGFFSPVICSPDNTFLGGTLPEDCRTPAAPAILYVRVHGFDLTAPSVYTLRASPVSTGGAFIEGSLGFGLLISPNIVKNATTGASFGIASYYEVSGLSGTVVISITGLDAALDLDLTVDDERFFAFPNISCPNTIFAAPRPEDCVIASSPATLHIGVTNYSSGGPFTLMVQN